MTEALVTKTMRLSPELYAEIEATMRLTGSKSFSDFAARALTNQTQIEVMRLEHLRTLAHEQAELAAAEDPGTYNQSPDPEADAQLKKDLARHTATTKKEA